MIAVENVSYAVGDFAILHDVSLTLPTGQIIALIGPNGAGKSTLFSLMSRLNPLQSGKVAFGEHDIATTDAKSLAKVVAMLTQENHVQGRLRVRELLMFGRYPYHQGRPTQADTDKVNEIIHAFELEALADRFLSDLSGGQRQRVLIAMIVCQDTPYLLLDEPLNNLDMYHAGRLMRKLKTLTTQGKTVVIVLHDINQAAQFADTVVMMKSGEVVSVGAPVDVLTAKSMKALYDVDVTVLTHNGKPVIVDVMQ
ncbi:iron ABC transporter ATP-binding protein [Moraxella caviae]|uniref:Iron ABC transporter ATP-binding protein n=1 Tax=Moraxella caviae TaxID=34060 RepID=A0A1T0A8D8_9GAMM|nr:ATP-binding cassette domain-containing protein [Moraxella caviae]OOR91879.1 iron ABC transporter ATP-binding protein [Moraxella caviae]STZ09729.1 Iron(3+)-hydroxamate import ATP-binding protein FhuC [Moraxella caviae]VEW11232.1 Iron(3+)-hydroxamate import ATP-binding protein FhuC [Moraxella caviae]